MDSKAVKNTTANANAEIHSQEFKLKADRRSVIIRAVGFTVKIVEREVS